MEHMSNKSGFIPPFAGILQLLLATGYNLAYCILELLDNSISKKSRHIRVQLYAEKCNGPLTRITVSDDGTGMDYQQLCESFVISQTPKDRDSEDIGKFGVGMKSAIMNMGTNISIISKVSNDKPIVGLNADIEMMKTNNTYNPTFLSEDVSKQFPDCLAASNREYFTKHASGTLIQVDRIRQLCAYPVKAAFKDLKLMFANSYQTLPEGSTITLETNQGDSVVIEPTDFFYTKDESGLDEKPYTTEFHVYERNEGEMYDQIIEVNTTARDLPNKWKLGKPGAPIYYKYRPTPVGQKISASANMERITSLPTTRLLGVIHIRVIQLTHKQFHDEEVNFGDNLHKDRKGFWFSRGIRSIGFGKRLGKKLHDRTAAGDYQRMHVSFPASLDDQIGSKFNKQMEDNALPSQALTDALYLIYKQVTNPWSKKWEERRAERGEQTQEQEETMETSSTSDDQPEAAPAAPAAPNVADMMRSNTIIDAPAVAASQQPLPASQAPSLKVSEESPTDDTPLPKKPKKAVSPVTSEDVEEVEVEAEAEEEEDETSSVTSSVPSPDDHTNDLLTLPSPTPAPVYTHSVVNGDLVFTAGTTVHTLKVSHCVEDFHALFRALKAADVNAYKKYMHILVQEQEYS